MNSSDCIHTYFSEEKLQSLLVILLGILSLAFALIFLFIIKYSFYKGMAVPLLIAGLIQVSMGTAVYLSSSKDLSEKECIFRLDPGSLKTEELRRMQKVTEHFRIYKWIEIILAMAGTVFFITPKKNSSSFWKGLGLGLMLQSGLTFTLDRVAEKRAEKYYEILRSLPL